METIHIVLNVVTFVGIAAAALGMNLPRLRPGWGLPLLGLGGSGLLVMALNANLPSRPVALALDLAYAGGCLVALLASQGWLPRRAGDAAPEELPKKGVSAPHR